MQIFSSLANSYLRICSIAILMIFFVSVGTPSVYSGVIDSSPYWIYFRDKGINGMEDISIAVERATENLSPKAKERRLRRGKGALTDIKDVPVNPVYISQLSKIDGVEIRHQSRWLNAVSANLTQDAYNRLMQLQFVSRISAVKSFIRQPDIGNQDDDPPPEQNPRRDWNLNYGGSLRQNEFMNVPELHDRGYSGRGILIGMLDTGYNNLDHTCFRDIDILAVWDFVNDDGNVGDEEDMGIGNHGTRTLSIVGGFEPGSMIGMAYGATFVLAKTENTDWEREIEEDHWVAAIEWMDELGVEVVNSSLSYIDWYDYEDLNGENSITSLATQRATEVGMIVVISMGNTGRNNYPDNKMGAPADAFGGYAAGATNQDSSYATFSSKGPTFDERIKPDFSTIGSSVRFASSRDDEAYGAGAGTSFSAPAIAGLCALLLEAYPLLNPESLRDLLRSTSNNSEEPDTLVGWGIPDGLAALREMQPDIAELVIPLNSGWNMVSHNLDFMFDLRFIMQDLVEAMVLVRVKDSEGRFYTPEFGFNNIPFWERHEGYLIKVSENAELILEGQQVRFNEPIELHDGWQMIAYLPDFEMQVETAFRSLLDNDLLIVAKDGQGRFFLPEFQFNNIPECAPTQGYLLNLREEGILTYPRTRNMEE